MSECVGDGCTYPGCSGRNAGAVNAVHQMANPAAALQADLYARQTAAEGINEPVAYQPNRADRRRAARMRGRDARRVQREG